MAQITKRLMYKAMQERIPVSAGFELTPRCNFSCKMCYVRQDAGQPAPLRPASFWERIAREGMAMGLFAVVLTGGETLLYPEFWELYTALMQMGMQVTINTNGSTITPALCRQLHTLPPARVSITLYGASNASYARFCGDPQGFDKVQRGVALLSEYGIPFMLSCSLGPDNAADLEQMVAFARRYGQKLRLTAYLLPPVRRLGAAGDFSGRFTPEEAGYYTVRAEYLQSRPEVFLKLAESRQQFCTLTDAVLTDMQAGAAGTVRCQAGRCNAWIDWRGDLGGCAFLKEPKYSLDTYTFQEAWERLAAWTKALRTAPACANCPNQEGCPSCIAALFGETKAFDQRPAYLCAMQRSCAKHYKAFARELTAAGYQADDSAALSPDACRQTEDVWS